jgi:hypothetical protein
MNMKAIGITIAGLGCVVAGGWGINDSIDSKATPVVQTCGGTAKPAAPVAAADELCDIDPLPDFVESDSDQLTELNKFDGPIEGDANWAVDDAGEGDDATSPQDAAPAVVDDFASVRWVGDKGMNPLAPTLTVYTRPQNCAPCRQLEVLLTDAEVVKQTRAWNCRVVILTSDSPAPYMTFAPTKANPLHLSTFVKRGCPETSYELATLLHGMWHDIMPPPEKSVVTGRRKLLPSLRGQR